MKILMGKFKGKNIKVPAGDARPVSNLVKKACFDILHEVVPDSSVLDVFAGSGALGLEALSQGAKAAVFVDMARPSINAVKKNIAALGGDLNTRVFQKDSFAAVKDFSVYGEEFDLIFVDPPYYNGMVKKLLQSLSEYDIVARSGFVVCFCYLKDEFIEDSKRFSLILKKKYGQTCLLVYQKQ